MAALIEMDAGYRESCESVMAAEAVVFQAGLSLGPLWRRETVSGAPYWCRVIEDGDDPLGEIVVVA